MEAGGNNQRFYIFDPQAYQFNLQGLQLQAQQAGQPLHPQPVPPANPQNEVAPPEDHPQGGQVAAGAGGEENRGDGEVGDENANGANPIDPAPGAGLQGAGNPDAANMGGANPIDPNPRAGLPEAGNQNPANLGGVLPGAGNAVQGFPVELITPAAPHPCCSLRSSTTLAGCSCCQILTKFV